jgi:hypothetical protein
MSRRFYGGDGFRDNNEEEEEEDETTWYSSDDLARDLQAGHGTHVAGMIYARGMHEADGEIASLRARFRKESRWWHVKVLGFSSSMGESIVRKRIREGESEEAQQAQNRR